MSQTSIIDLKKFNADFDKQLEEDTLTESEIVLDNKPDDKKNTKEKNLNEFTLIDLAIKYKEAMIRIVDIIVKSDYKTIDDIKNVLGKLFANENILYLGITLVSIALLGYILTN